MSIRIEFSGEIPFLAFSDAFLFFCKIVLVRGEEDDRSAKDCNGNG